MESQLCVGRCNFLSTSKMYLLVSNWKILLNQTRADVLCNVRVVPEERHGGLAGSVGVLVNYREYTGRMRRGLCCSIRETSDLVIVGINWKI